MVLITHNHLLVLANSDTLALNDLDVVQTAKNLVLNLELGRHGEFHTFLDFEWLVLQRCLGAFLAKVDGHWRSSLTVHGQGEDDADSWIRWVGNIFAFSTKT